MADLYKLINGTEKVKLTDDEKTQREADIASSVDLEKARAQRIDDQKTGNKKLLDLGLTQAEATALTGYVPPAE